MMTIDAHQHFWTFDPVQDTWLAEPSMAVLQRDFLPQDLQPIISAHGIDATIAVQVAQNDQETRALLKLSSHHPFIAGVVGWIDLKAADLNEKLQHYQQEKKLVGFRHILQSEPQGFMTDPAFIRGVDTILQEGYTYDLLVYEHQLEEANSLVRQLNGQKIMVDHLAKPAIAKGSIEAWRKQMQKLAKNPGVYCKISGMVTEASWTDWQPQDLHPYIDTVLNLFGTKRCVYGSDWPVCTLAATYEQVFEVLNDYICQLSKSEQSDILGSNCRDFYGIA